MILTINGTDYSNYIQHKVDISETPRYIDGANSGVSINGTAIWDRIATKYDLTVRLKPMPQDKIYSIINATESEPVVIEYTSFRSNTTRTITALCTASQINYLMTDNGKRIYGEMTLTFEEQ